MNPKRGLGEKSSNLTQEGSHTKYDCLGRLRNTLAKRKDASCFLRFVVERISNPVTEHCMKTIWNGVLNRKATLLRSLIELHLNVPLKFPTKELNDMDNYSKGKEMWRYFIKK